MVKETIEEDTGMSGKLDYKSKDKDLEGLFKNRQDERVGLIEESISDIKDMITERGKLNSEILQSLDKIDIFINNAMPKPELGNVIHAHELIKELLKKKVEIEELKVKEKLDFWKDIALLKKELREHMKEFRDMQSKTSMIDNILEI